MKTTIGSLKHIKEKKMPEFILRQLEYESNSLKRLLAFIIDENIHLKNRLSQILKDDFDKTTLDDLEVFHTSFLRHDELTAILRNDLVELDRCMSKEKDGISRINEISDRLKQLRNSITHAEAQFSKLKHQFNTYLADNILYQ